MRRTPLPPGGGRNVAGLPPPPTAGRRPPLPVLPALLLFAATACGGAATRSGDGEVRDDAVTPGDADEAFDDATDGETPPVPAPPLADDEGRAVFYIGVNLGEETKRPPDFLPDLGDGELELLEEWGVTLVRFLVLWEAIEPERGVFDEAYLGTVRAQLDRLAAHGIDAVLDMHQDIFGRGFGFAGAPRWACDEAHYADFTPMEPWFMNYFSEDVEACFDALWSDRTLWDELRDAWAHAAAALGAHPAVIGFDLFNEPFQGSIATTTFEREVLPAFHAHLAAAFTGAAAAKRVFVEPAVTYDFSPQTRLPPFAAGEGFAPHYYPTFVAAGSYSGRESDVAADLRDMAGDAARLGGPLFLGEFGIANDAGDAAAYLADMIDGTLALGGSMAPWDFSRGGPGGYGLRDPDGVPYPCAAALRRPYVHRLAGRLVSTTYDRATGTLDVTWEETGLEAPSIFVVPTGPECRLESVSSTTDPAGSFTVAAGTHANRLVLDVSAAVPVHSFRLVRPCADAAP
ncbi:MAG: cellulase family glycosylhydrolase [Deltaproteobacteria bacterium]|nr:cellulase family glycosylhydrolase [Deltaproteobacteria bacterium]